MADVWYYAKDKKIVGPIPLENLEVILSMVPDPYNLRVWKVGFSDWTVAGAVKELAPLPGTRAKQASEIKPPPLPPRPPPLDVEPQLRGLLYEVSAVSTPVASQKASSKWRKSAKGIVSFLVFVAAFAIVRSITQSSYSSSQTPPP